MSVRRHLLAPELWQTLRALAEAGDPDAIRAAQLWDQRRHAPVRSRERRHLTRAFERAAGRALKRQGASLR